MNCLPTYWVIDLWHTLVGNVDLVSFSLPAPAYLLQHDYKQTAAAFIQECSLLPSEAVMVSC